MACNHREQCFQKDRGHQHWAPEHSKEKTKRYGKHSIVMQSKHKRKKITHFRLRGLIHLILVRFLLFCILVQLSGGKKLKGKQYKVYLTNRELHGPQPPRPVGFSLPGSFQKTVAPGSSTARNIIKCVSTNHRPRKLASDQNEITTLSITHKHNPGTRLVYPTETRTYTQYDRIRHTPHRVHRSHTVHNKHTVNPQGTHKNPQANTNLHVIIRYQI